MTHDLSHAVAFPLKSCREGGREGGGASKDAFRGSRLAGRRAEPEERTKRENSNKNIHAKRAKRCILLRFSTGEYPAAVDEAFFNLTVFKNTERCTRKGPGLENHKTRGFIGVCILR